MAFECCELNHLATFCRDCFPRPLKLLFFFQGLITTNNLLAMEGSHRFRRRRCQRVVKNPACSRSAVGGALREAPVMLGGFNFPVVSTWGNSSKNPKVINLIQSIGHFQVGKR